MLLFLICFFLLISSGPSYLPAHRPYATHSQKHYRKNKKKKLQKRRPKKIKHIRHRQRKLLRKKTVDRSRSHKTKRRHRHYHFIRTKTRPTLSPQSRRIRHMHDNLPPDFISVPYAELKVRRMLAHSNLPSNTHAVAFKKIMKTLDRYEKNDHVSLQDMNRAVSQEIH